ncbi:MAG: metallophosphoesterase [Pseudomonadota bacterium]
MKLLLISDIHLGDKARCESLKPNYSNSVDRDYLKRLEEFQSKYDVKPDKLIFPGDMTNTASASEFREFDRILEKLLTIFSIDIENCFFTIGNHDSDWQIQRLFKDGDVFEDYFDRRYDNIDKSKYLKLIAERSIRYDGAFDYFVWDDANLTVLALNSGFPEKFDDAVKAGFIDPSVLEAIESKYADILSNDQFKILLVHHHPHLYSNPMVAWKDFSAAQNADILFEFCEKYRIDTVLHGHRHIPAFKSELFESGMQVHTICCGSFSAKLDYRLQGIASNCIHVLDIEASAPSSTITEGRLLTWSFIENKGWVKSSFDRDGIEHVISFGQNLHASKIIEQLEEIDLENDQGFLRLRDFLTPDKEMTKMRWSSLKKIFQEHCDRKGWEMVGDQIEDSVILFR